MALSPPISLIFPPVCDVRAPYLALPSLAAFLRKNGCCVIQKDVNLEATLYFLKTQNLQKAYQKVKNKYYNFNKRKSISSYELKYYYKLARRVSFAPFVIRNVEKAKRILRDRYDFFDINKHNAARAIIDEALSLYAHSYDPSIEYKLDGQCYETKHNPYNLKELKKAICDIKNNIFIDYFNTQTVPHILKEKPILAGISIATKHQILPGLTMAYMLKRQGIYVVIGGSYFTRFIDELKSNNAFFDFCDSVIVYEGEHALVELIEQLKTQSPDFSKVPNLIYPQNGSVKINLPIYVEDLNKLPAPDFDGLALDKYLTPQPVLPLALGKGCYWDMCRFCSIPFSSRLKTGSCRRRKIKNIISDIELLSRKYSARHFFFTDESVSSRRLLQLSSGLEKNKMKINYSCFARLEPQFTDKVCKKISRWGCRKIVFGLESGYQKTLDFINKGQKIATVEKVLKNCHKNKIAYCLFVIIGFPNETKAAINKSIDFLYKNRKLIESPFNSLYVHQFQLDKHTEFFANPRKYKIVNIENKRDEIFRDGGWNYKTERTLDYSQAKRIYAQIYNKLSEDFIYSSINKNGVPGWEEYDILFIDYFRRNSKKWSKNIFKESDVLSLKPFWSKTNSLQKLKFDPILLDGGIRIEHLKISRDYILLLQSEDKMFEFDMFFKKIIPYCNGEKNIAYILKEINFSDTKKGLRFFCELLRKNILVLDTQKYFREAVKW